jgi:hypothetical protein
MLLGAAFIFAPLNIHAQGQLYVSNLGESPSVGEEFSDSMWLAQLFVTGTNPEGYDLNSVQLSLDLTGAPAGNVVVYLYGTDDESPVGEGEKINSVMPSASGICTFNASGIFLSPSTYYYIGVTATDNAATSPYEWNEPSDYNYISSDNWSLPATPPWSSTDGSHWESYIGFEAPPYLMAVTATPVPEPGILSLVEIGLAIIVLSRRRFETANRCE